MPLARHVTVRDGDVVLLVGTMKGAFVLRSDGARRVWQQGGPYFPGHSVYALAYDGRQGRRRIWAAPESMHWGSDLSSSDDFGRSWTKSDSAPIRFAEDTAQELKRVWQLRTGRPGHPNEMWAGVEPASLFRSEDGGTTWSLVRALFDHPHRPQWQPGGGGLCLHSVVLDPDPRRIFVAISTGGVYRSDNEGHTWQVKNRGVRAEFLPDKHPEFGQCVHKIVQHPSRPERLYLQNHWGLYRTDDAGDSWQDIANGVPSDFGFGMAIHPHDPETVYIVPLESDEFRCTPEGRMRVYRTRDGGKSWQPMTRGLPQKNALETVLRDSLATDTMPRAGVYFGTRSGRVYGSADEGTSWQLLAEGLPPVVCVKAVVIGEPKPSRTRPAAKRSTAKKSVSKKSARKAARRPARKAAPRKKAPARKKAARRAKTARRRR